jgi:hypothetical protein
MLVRTNLIVLPGLVFNQQKNWIGQNADGEVTMGRIGMELADRYNLAW